MLDQLIALGVVVIGAIAFAIHGLRNRDRPSPRPSVSPFFKDLTGEVGRAAEAGASIHVGLGHGGLTGPEGMTTVAALQGLSSLIDLSAAYDTPPYITTGDPTTYLLADHRMRRAYARLGNAGRYRPEFVHFSAHDPLLYAAMTSALLHDRPIDTNIMMGSYGQEISLLGEAAQRRGIKSLGGTTTLEGSAALYPVLPDDRQLIGESLFAGGAAVTDRTSFDAGLRAQNVLRWLVVVTLVATAILSLLGLIGG
jgi:hypothetical protein